MARRLRWSGLLGLVALAIAAGALVGCVGTSDEDDTEGGASADRIAPCR